MSKRSLFILLSTFFLLTSCYPFEPKTDDLVMIYVPVFDCEGKIEYSEEKDESYFISEQNKVAGALFIKTIYYSDDEQDNVWFNVDRFKDTAEELSKLERCYCDYYFTKPSSTEEYIKGYAPIYPSRLYSTRRNEEYYESITGIDLFASPRDGYNKSSLISN